MNEIDLDTKPRPLEFVCDVCLRSVRGNDAQAPPLCPRCQLRMTPEDLAVPHGRYSPHRTPRKAAV